MLPSVIKRFIFTALACEAKPLVAQLKLKKVVASAAFTLYADDETALVISGCGKLAMAAAVAYSQAYFTACPHPVLVNVGIAGQDNAPLGTLFAVHKIIDQVSGKAYYPQCVSALPCATLPLYTVAQPVRQYADAALYDMEASGFYELASRFTSAELIQCFKVVSDNRHSSIDKINEKWATELMAAQVLPIIAGLDSLTATAQSLVCVESSAYYEQAVSQWHFSVTAQFQLKGLLQRWTVITDNAPLDFNEVERPHSKAVLQWLENKLAAVPLTFDSTKRLPVL